RVVFAPTRAVLGPRSVRTVDVELEPAVGRSMDERVLGRRPPRARLPEVAALVEEVERLALGSLGVAHRRRAEPELAGGPRDRRRPHLGARAGTGDAHSGPV